MPNTRARSDLGSPMMPALAGQRLVLRHEWLLRPDGDVPILYLLSNYESAHFTLSFETAVALALFDGIRSWDEVVQLASYVFDTAPAETSSFLRQILIELCDPERYPVLADHPILGPTDPVSVAAFDADPMAVALPRAERAVTNRLAYPISLLLLFTTLCQTDCRYCYAPRVAVPRRHWLPMARWGELIDEACAMGVRKVAISGGDVFARPDGLEFIEMLLEHDLLFLLSTKSRIAPQMAGRMAGAGFAAPVHGVARELQYSVDSVIPEIADHLTQRRGYVERTKSSLRSLLDVGIEPKVKAVITAVNCEPEHFRRYTEEMIALGIRRINFTQFEPSFYRRDDTLTLTEEMKLRISDQLSDYRARYPEVEFDGNAFTSTANLTAASDRQDLARWRARAGCSGGRVELGITSDGKAVLCEQTPEDAPFAVGDLRTTSIADVWRSQALLDLIFPARERFRGTPCFECDEFDACQILLGSCFRDAFFATGTPFEAPPNCPHRPPIDRNAAQDKVLPLRRPSWRSVGTIQTS